MPKKAIYTKVGERKLKLTNLDKVLYPEANIIKAELIEYYAKLAVYMLPYIKGRPLSFVRYPDGIDKHKFFQKDRPSWTPEWIRSVLLSKAEGEKNYLIAEEDAALVWMANMACLELHCMQVDNQNLHKPDYFVFDLDPPEKTDFQLVKEIALSLKPFLEAYGYTPFIKTSGGKGLHLICPINPKWDIETVIKAVKDVANAFQKENKSTTTLHIQKAARKGRLLLDIYRNHKGQTTVAPYSTRGKPGAPVSMPIPWNFLEDLEASNQFTIRNAFTFIEEKGLPWENWKAAAVDLHTERKEKANTKKNKKEISPKIKPKNSLKKGDVNEMEKHPLNTYETKRDFTKTPEPISKVAEKDSNQFVIHLHDASNLHYDLRLQAEGVLHSWAIPKGLPSQVGIKRLAIQTEPHPAKYLDFEGIIPKKEYGGGEMWVFARGTYLTKNRKDSKWTFSLKSKALNGDFTIYKLREDQWLVEKKNESENKSIFENIPKPMLAESCRKLKTHKDFVYEIKWDGIRVLIIKETDTLKIISRSGRDITKHFPEIVEAEDQLKTESGIFDGEIVCLDAQGRPDFAKVISRMHSSGKDNIAKKSKSNPAYAYLFDCLHFGGINICREPLWKRKAWVKAALKKGKYFRLSEAIEDGEELYEAAKAMELEGIMLKNKNAPYETGKRCSHWIKIKYRNTNDYHIVGYTEGEGDRIKLFGALHLIEMKNDEMIYRGKVGSGFNQDSMKLILPLLEKQGRSKKLIKDKLEDDRRSKWIKPGLVCEIEYASMTKNGTLREPVFLRLREDLFY